MTSLLTIPMTADLVIPATFPISEPDLFFRHISITIST